MPSKEGCDNQYDDLKTIVVVLGEGGQYVFDMEELLFDYAQRVKHIFEKYADESVDVVVNTKDAYKRLVSQASPEELIVVINFSYVDKDSFSPAAPTGVVMTWGEVYQLDEFIVKYPLAVTSYDFTEDVGFGNLMTLNEMLGDHSMLTACLILPYFSSYQCYRDQFDQIKITEKFQNCNDPLIRDKGLEKQIQLMRRK